MSSSWSTILSILATALVLGLAAGLSEAQGTCTSSDPYVACPQGKLCTAVVEGPGSSEEPTCGACSKPWWFFPSTCFCGRTGVVYGPKGPAVYCNPSKEYCQRKSGIDFSSYACVPLLASSPIGASAADVSMTTIPGPPDESSGPPNL